MACFASSRCLISAMEGDIQFFRPKFADAIFASKVNAIITSITSVLRLIVTFRTVVQFAEQGCELGLVPVHRVRWPPEPTPFASTRLIPPKHDRVRCGEVIDTNADC